MEQEPSKSLMTVILTMPVVTVHTNNYLGTPQELTDDDGNVVWANYEWAWGGRYTHFYKEQSLNGCAILEHELQSIRFQGQFYDVETGLHYNRFRYYDSDVGMFIGRDPIGLLGGSNVFQYAPNPIHWVDVLGLSKSNKTPAKDCCKKDECDTGEIKAWIAKDVYSKLNESERISFTKALSKGMVTSAKGQEGIKILNNFKYKNTKYFYELKTAPHSQNGNKRLYGNIEEVKLPAKKGCKPTTQKMIVFREFVKSH